MAPFYDVYLYYCFEKKGVLTDPLNEDSFLPTLEVKQYQNLKTEGIISEGMIPKLDNAFSVLQHQVREVIIGDIQSLSGTTGTILKN